MSPILPNAPAVYSSEPAVPATNTATSPIREFLSKRGSGRLADNSFAAVMLLCACTIFAIVLFILVLLLRTPVSVWFSSVGSSSLLSAWDPVSGDFGALPFIFGTLATSLLALCMAVPLALGVAIFLTELCPRALRADLFPDRAAGGYSSVVYGLWAVFVLVPLIRTPSGLSSRRRWAGPASSVADLWRRPAYGEHHPRHHDSPNHLVVDPGHHDRCAEQPA